MFVPAGEVEGGAFARGFLSEGQLACGHQEFEGIICHSDVHTASLVDGDLNISRLEG